jgi:TPR repeat protein
LFERAAAKGHVGAMFATAVMCDGGHGVPSDWVTAQRWLRAAAERGHAGAQTMLAVISRKNSPANPIRDRRCTG